MKLNNFKSLLFTILMTISYAQLSSKESPIIAAYYENWSQFRSEKLNRKPFTPSMIDSKTITDLYYAFAIFGYVTPSIDKNNPRLTGNFKIEPLYPEEQKTLYKQLNQLKIESEGTLKSHLSIGGDHFNNPNDSFGIGHATYKLFSEMVSNSENRQEFIESVISYAQEFGFDGVDIDWEYPGDSTRGGKPEDLENFLVFLQECSQAFKKTKPALILSMAAPPLVPRGLPEKYQKNPALFYQWLAKCSDYVDRLTLMAYNYHTPYNQAKITGVNAPLNRDTNQKSHLFVAQSLNNYLQYGIPAEKILLGLPLYGWGYSGVEGLSKNTYKPGIPFKEPAKIGPTLQAEGFLAYFEIADLVAIKQLELAQDPLTNTAIAYNPIQRTWVSFDTPETLSLKAKVAKDQRLGGINFWAIDLDEYQWNPKFPNIKAVNKILN